MAIAAHYSDGLSAKSIPALLTVEAGRLLVHARNGGELLASWPLETLSASSSFAVQTVLLSSMGGGSELQLPTEDFVASIRPHLKSHSWAEKFTGSRHRNKKLLAISVVCAAVVVALAFGLRLATHRAARLVPLSLEKRVFGGLAAELPGLVECKSPAVEAELRKLADQLSTKKERESMPLEIKVIRMSMPNAFAFLGGQIYFTSEFLEQAGSVDEVAGVLSHEIEHVAQRHVLTHVLDNFGFAALLRPFSGSREPAFLAALLQLRYSRADEAQADAGGGARLDRAGYSRKGLVDFFQRIEGKTAKTPLFGEFLSSHPETGARMALFAAQAPPPLTNAAKARVLKILNTACRKTE